MQDVIPGTFRDIYKVKAMGCGLCQVSVPCESEIPPELVNPSLDLSIYS